MTEDVAGGNIDIVRIRFFDLVDVRLDVLHVSQIFYRPFFAGGNDQPLLADAQRNLGLAGLEVDRLGQLNHLAGAGRHLNLDQRLNLGLEGSFAPAGAAGRTVTVVAFAWICSRVGSLVTTWAADLLPPLHMIMIVIRARGHVDVDKGAQAIVLAEVASGVFIARGAIANVAHRFQPDKGGPLAVLPQTQGLLCGTDGA